MSVYPGAIPSSGDLPDAGANLSSNPHSSLHDDVRDEVIAIATELGVEPSGTEATVRARLDQGLGLREIVTFTSDGTFTKATYPWLRAVRVRCQGGGGAGGGATATSAGQASFGSGGSAGGYSESFILASNLDESISVTVGEGGTGASGVDGNAGTGSLFGALVTTEGGNGGFTRAAGTPPLAIRGIGGAAIGTGDLAIEGGASTPAISVGATAATVIAGAGANSFLGGGGVGTTANPQPGRGFGGGGGGLGNTANSAAAPGADGADGIVIVELYA